jgi:transcriptional regulator with PAS, ATPase and Fis domain
MDGIEAANQIHTHLNIPIIYLTAYDSKAVLERAKITEPFGYIIKPFEERELFITIEMAFYKHKAEDKMKKAFLERMEYKNNLEAIFKTIRDGIILLDNELKIVEFNESARRICDFPDINQARGKEFELLHINCKGDCCEAVMETKKTMHPAEKNRFECFNSNKPKSLVSVSTYPLHGIKGKFNGCVVVVKDETKLAVLESCLQERQQFHNIIGKCKEMLTIYSMIETLSDTPTTVLLTGESGTGKRLVAEALHYHVKGSEKKPFVVVSCSSLSDNLLESELFGHVKGAFTGAVSDRAGRFQMAEGGTVFLDEIGDISVSMQLRLLRVLEERVIERVGDSNTIKVNVRVVTATNRDLRRQVRDGKFREDLYHRLKVVEIALPPLRHRLGDFPLLIDFFINKLNLRLNKHIKAVSKEVQKIFINYKWPGNVRELYNTMEYAFTICDNSIITKDDLPIDLTNIESHNRRRIVTGKTNERQRILQALEKTGWNKAKAARMLSIHRVTIHKKIKKYRIIEKQ